MQHLYTAIFDNEYVFNSILDASTSNKVVIALITQY